MSIQFSTDKSSALMPKSRLIFLNTPSSPALVSERTSVGLKLIRLLINFFLGELKPALTILKNPLSLNPSGRASLKPTPTLNLTIAESTLGAGQNELFDTLAT